MVSKAIIALVGIVVFVQPVFSSSVGQITENRHLTNDNLMQFDDVRERKVSVKFTNKQLSDVLTILARKADVGISYKANLIPNKKINYKAYKESIFDVLGAILNGTGLYATLSNNGKAIFIKEHAAANQQRIHTVGGTVTDAETGEALAGANIFVKGTRRGTNTNANGKYVISVNDGAEAILRFSFVGYEKKEVKINNRDTLNVALQPNVATMEDLVVTGIVERETDSFTGTISTYDQEELQAVGNDNLLESLKTIDPSFVILENNNFGDDPNRLPAIEVRGRTSTSQDDLEDEFGGDPNQPLFILDGFETSLQTIVDLDMGRVKSVSILKDASSTALYGAKAANGVVVVETIQPRAGALRVSYSADLRVSDPDLDSYNLMNAEQKLEFEKKSGYYSALDPSDQVRLDSTYNARLANVRRGLDTYWLDEPVRTGVTQGHSIYVEGGAGEIRYGLGVDYRDIDGVMKGSGRERWGGNLDLIYRKDKLNITNKVYINGFNATDSPYGSFSTYANAVPYFAQTNSAGQITRYLDQSRFEHGQQIVVSNPLYNASLNSKNNTSQFDVQNNLKMNYRFNNAARLQGGLQLKRGSQDGVLFIPPENTQFDNVGLYERGRYTETQTDNFSYRGNITFTYAKVFAEKHRLTSNFRAEIENNEDERIRNVAVGFPAGSNGNPSFAFGYDDEGRPASTEQIFRRNSVLASTNYAYDERYLFDATFRLDGSTAFGSDRQYSPFWSTGVGWNLHNEAFFNVESINTLRFRANIGITGNQNFGSVSSVSVYSYNNDTNIFGQGVILNSLGNSNLDWQKTRSTNFSLDLVMFDNRLNATVSAFQNFTDPLVVVLDQPSSTGITGYPTNAGNLDTRGIEANIKVQPIYQPDNGIIWTVGVLGSFVKSEYGGFNNLLESLNDEALENSSLIRYKNGYSPDDIWAVRSLGIDPGTGREIFIDSQGNPTFTHNPQNEAVVGNTRPAVEGVISNSVTYKSFTLGLNLRYRFGGDLFNRALYNKVENISESELDLNQDARALTERWQEPGDEAKFKAIDDSDFTPISSRFVQEENVIIGESIRLGYQVTDAEWLNKIGLSRFRFNVYMNDIFRISSVKAERGIDYPFANTISSSINISF